MAEDKDPAGYSRFIYDENDRLEWSDEDPDKSTADEMYHIGTHPQAGDDLRDLALRGLKGLGKKGAGDSGPQP